MLPLAMAMHCPGTGLASSLPLLPVPGQTRRFLRAKADLCYDLGRISSRDAVSRSAFGAGRLIPAEPDAGYIFKKSLVQRLSDSPLQFLYHPLYKFMGRSSIGLPDGFNPTQGTPEHHLLEAASKFQGVMVPAILVSNPLESCPAFGSSHQLSPPVMFEVRCCLQDILSHCLLFLSKRFARNQ